MLVERKVKMEVGRNFEGCDGFMIGDRISVGKYTATCQITIVGGGLFLMDQYLDDCLPMNISGSNEGGYEKSELRECLNKYFVNDPMFDPYRHNLVRLENGDVLRIPFAEEMFGGRVMKFEHVKYARQWELMKQRRNRFMYEDDVKGGLEIGWLQNKVKYTDGCFATIEYDGRPSYANASHSLGIRLVFGLYV